MSRPFFLGNPHSPWTELPPGLRETITALTGICRRPETGRRAGSPPLAPRRHCHSRLGVARRIANGEGKPVARCVFPSTILTAGSW